MTDRGVECAETEPRHRRLTIDGRAAHFTVVGPQGAAWVLLLHGLGTLAAEMTAALASPLVEAGFRVLAVDRPGYGFSDLAPVDAAGPAAQALWLTHLLEAVEVRPAVVVAHSFGAAVALWIETASAGKPPLVLINPFCRPTQPAAAPLLRLAVAPGVGPLIRRGLPAAGGHLLKRSLARACAPDRLPASLAGLRATSVIHERSVLAMAGELRSYNADAERLPTSGSARRQIAVLSGRHDRVIASRAHVEWLQCFAPQVEHRALCGGHMLHHTRPEAVLQAVGACA